MHLMQLNNEPIINFILNGAQWNDTESKLVCPSHLNQYLIIKWLKYYQIRFNKTHLLSQQKCLFVKSIVKT